VIVRFNFKRDSVVAADIDDAGVFSRTLQHQRAASGELLQVNARAFVGAVLAPHHTEDSELGDLYALLTQLIDV
jgi:hypothetical protein